MIIIKRPILVIVIGYIIGIIMGLYKNISIVPLYIFLAIIYFIYKKINLLKNKKLKFKLLSFKRYFRYIKLVISKNVLVTIIISSIISNTITIIQNKRYENKYKDGDQILGKAIVISNVQEKEYSNMYKIKLLKNGDKFYLKLNKKQSKLQYGEEIELKGEFIEPQTARNKGGFNYKKYLKTLKIYGTINVEKVVILEKNRINPILKFSNNIHIKIEEQIEKYLDEKQAGILKGILLGDSKKVEEEIQENFRISNISHVLAVSGMHVNYIILGMNFLLKPLFGKRRTRKITIIFLVFYMFITGFSASIVRAGVMGIIIILGKLIHRKEDTWTSISISLLILLINNPFSILNISLQLSFAGTMGLVLFNKKIPGIFSITLCAQIMIFPIMIYHFNIFGTYFLITNLLAGIIIGPIIVIGILGIFSSIFSFTMAKILFLIVKVSVEILILISKFSELSMAKIYLPTPRIWQIIIYYIIVFFIKSIYEVYSEKKPTATFIRVKNLLALAKYKFRKNKRKNIKKIMSILIILLITFTIIKKQCNTLNINFVDVGQGDSCFIITPKKKTILVDGGGSQSKEFDVGKSTLLPYILNKGYTQLDYIVISHFDYDHVGGILYIMQEIKVKNIIIGKQFEDSENYEKFVNLVQQKDIKVRIVEAGEDIKIEKNLNFNVVWPNSKSQISDNSINNNSLVFKMKYKNFSMLFTGDIEEIAEKKILQTCNVKNLESLVLKVPHHGSKTSSSQEFLDAVRPKIALIGVGKNNKFGHPSDITLEKFKMYDTKVYRTDQKGEITLKTDGNKIKIY